MNKLTTSWLLVGSAVLLIVGHFDALTLNLHPGQLPLGQKPYQKVMAPFGDCWSRGRMESEHQGMWRLPPTSDHGFVQGLVYAASGDYSSAVSALEKSYQLTHRQLTAFYVGNLYSLLGREDKAIEWWKKNGGAEFLLEHAQSCSTLGMEPEEQRYLTAARQALTDASPEMYAQFVKYYGEQGTEADLNWAIEGLERLAAKQDPEVQLLISQALYAQGRFAEALSYSVAAMQAKPNSYEAYYWASLAAFATQDYESARQYALQSLAILPRQPGPLLVLGHVSRVQGNLDEALEWYRQSGGYTKSLAAMASTRIEQGRYDEALNLIRRAVELDPKNESLRSLLSEVCQELGERDCGVER